MKGLFFEVLDEYLFACYTLALLHWLLINIVIYLNTLKNTLKL